MVMVAVILLVPRRAPQTRWNFRLYHELSIHSLYNMSSLTELITNHVQSGVDVRTSGIDSKPWSTSQHAVHFAYGLTGCRYIQGNRRWPSLSDIAEVPIYEHLSSFSTAPPPPPRPCGTLLRQKKMKKEC